MGSSLRHLIVLAAVLFAADGAFAAYQPPAGPNGATQFNNNGYPGGYTPHGDCTTNPTTGLVTCNNTDGLASIGVMKKTINALASNTTYAAGVTTYSGGTFTAAKGPQPLPTTLAANQVYFVNFNEANPAAASLIVGTLPAKPIKVLSALGSPLTLVGGEIVAGPATLYYDGTEFIYSGPVSVAEPVTSGVSAAQADFTGHTTFYLTSGPETITLPCANTLSPNGYIAVFSVSGTATIAKGSACSDTLTKNGSSGTSATVAQGAAQATVTTDGSSHFYMSGQ